MNPLFLIGLVAANAFLGAFVFLKSRHKLLNRTFAQLVLCLVLWTIILYLSDIKNSQHLLLFNRLTFLPVAFLPFLLLLFANNFPVSASRNRNIKILSFGIPISVLFAILSLTPLIVEDIRIEPERVDVITGAGYLVFLVYFITFTFLSFVELIKQFKHSKGIARLQSRYLITGFALTAIVGSITNLILPFITQTNPLAKYGPVGTIFLVSFTAYAIVKHRLLDIRAAITRSIIFFLLLLYITSAFTFTTFLTGRYFQAISGGNQIVVNLFVSILIVLGLDPLRRFISNATDQLFFKARVNYQEITRHISEILSTEIDLERLVESVTNTLEHSLKLKGAAILVSDKTSYRSIATITQPEGHLTLSGRSSNIAYMKRTGRIAVLEELYRKVADTNDAEERTTLEKSRNELEQLGAGLLAPITSQEKLTGMLMLGPKMSGDVFSGDDIQLLEVIGPQIGSAIEKAKLYDEVKTFSEKLKVEVDTATQDLKLANLTLRERNLSLAALQKITSLVTRTLKLQEVVQTIADSISTELGYLGGIVQFRSEDGKSLIPIAMTRTKLTDRAMKLLPRPFEEYKGDLEKGTTIDIRAMRQRQVLTTDKLSDALSPPVPGLVANAIQKLTKIRAIVTVPIISEEEAIGAIHFALAKPIDEVKQQEVEMMRAVADQLGIVYRNINLFDKLRKANDDLEHANEHLRTLDQAKSEFISIASHQLRTPMTGIMGYLSMIVGGDFGRVQPKLKKLLAELLGESQRMIRLINLFLNVSKIEAGRLDYTMREGVDIVDLVSRQVHEVVKVAADKGLQLIFQPPKAKPPLIAADADKIADVILNLVDNAMKYTEKGKVTVSIDHTHDDVTVHVRDTGIGIHSREAAGLFNKFVRGSGIAKINPDGSGLGLFIAKRMVEMHHGSIWVTSDGIGKGSTFSFTLPVHQPNSVAAVVA